jgi:prephenate dehydrogenase
MGMVQIISIIGAGGKMGSWFMRYFSRKSHTKVFAYDKNGLWKPPGNVTLSESAESCAREADLVIVCVPITVAPKVIKRCALSMKSGATLAEISSIKAKTFFMLKKYSKRVIPLCIHPMFGPGASNIRDARILLIPVQNEKTELEALSSLIQGSEIVVIPSAHVHDKYMAIILGMTYFANLIFANILSKEDILFLEKISGTFFGIQLLLILGILSDDPDLIASIISQNAYTEKYISAYLDEAETLRRTLEGMNRDKDLLRNIFSAKSIFEQNFDLQKSYKKIYTMIRSQKGLL